MQEKDRQGSCSIAPCLFLRLIASPSFTPASSNDQTGDYGTLQTDDSADRHRPADPCETATVNSFPKHGVRALACLMPDSILQVEAISGSLERIPCSCYVGSKHISI